MMVAVCSSDERSGRDVRGGVMEKVGGDLEMEELRGGKLARTGLLLGFCLVSSESFQSESNSLTCSGCARFGKERLPSLFLS